MKNKKIIITVVFALFSIISYAQVKVACVGNSITYGSGIKDRTANSYPAQLQKMLGEEWEIKNFGVSGATMLKKGDKPYWEQDAYQKALDFKPDIVIIKLGTNDSKPQNWKYKNEYSADYTEMINEFKALGSVEKIYICLPIPVFENRWGITKSIVEGVMQEKVKAIANENDVSLIDLYKPFVGEENLVCDKIHPNAEGAGLMAKIIGDRLLSEVRE